MGTKKEKHRYYKTKFKFDKINLDYEIQLKKSHKWWWLVLMLLIPLLLFAVFLIHDYYFFYPATGCFEDNIEDIEIVIENECEIILDDEDDGLYKSLEAFFPPIRSQGEYGTCVCWATGYYLMTALNAIDKGWTTADLAMEENQISPKDLWISIAPDEKRPFDEDLECAGTFISSALDILQSNGVASLRDVPYEMKNSCGIVGGTGNELNKITKYRPIAEYGSYGMTVENFKRYLNNDMPIVFSGNVGIRFGKWEFPYILRTSAVFDHDVNIKGRHAMVITGYDDFRQAFRIRNSWGDYWGDKGSIWVAYNYFLNGFCNYAFVAGLYDDDNLDPSPDSGMDLMVSYAKDAELINQPGYRSLEFEIYNSGDKEILSEYEWVIASMLYNAKNANEHYMISYDFVSTKYQESETMIENDDVLCGYDIYINFQFNPKEPRIKRFEYKLPENLNGKYYIAIVADVMDAISEVNERNNFWFIGDEDGNPILFENGKMLNKPATPVKDDDILPDPFSDHPFQTLVKPGNLNTYTPCEIKRLIQCELNKKMNQSK